jgi:hypothetical protein
MVCNGAQSLSYPDGAIWLDKEGWTCMDVSAYGAAAQQMPSSESAHSHGRQIWAWCFLRCTVQRAVLFGV